MTELCHGTLYDLVVNSIKLTSYQLRNVVLRQIVEGVKYLHKNNIIHRDLKPSNILYRIDPLVMKLADVGCRRSVPEGSNINTHQSLMNPFREFGTDGWLAPEFINGETHLKPPHADDIYPLGIIFAFTLCGGKHPYGEDIKTRADLIKNKQPMLETIKYKLIDEYGDGCCDLIKQMIDPNPEKRPTTAEVLKNDLFPRPITRDSKV